MARATKAGVRAAAVSSVVLMAAAAAEATPSGYVALDVIAARHQLRTSPAAVRGVVVCEGDGLRLTAGTGMSVVLVNGSELALEDPVVEENGRLYLPEEAAAQIAVRARAPKPRPVPHVPALRPPAPPPVAVPVSVAPPPPPAAPPASAPSRAVRGRPVPPLPHAFTVMIDAGHGGEHTGGKGRTGLMEKEVNLDVALRLQRRLAAAGVRVLMTRTADRHFSEDRNDDLRRRFDANNRAYPDLFISIHSNYAENRSARGFEVFVRRERTSDRQEKSADARSYPIPAERAGGLPMDDPAVARMLYDVMLDRSAEGSRLLAREIETRFARGLATENRGIKEQDFQVVRWSNCPAVLVELEFISNPQGERDLGSAEHREKLASLLAESVDAFRARWAPGGRG